MEPIADEKEIIAWQWLYSSEVDRQEMEKMYEWLAQYIKENVGRDWGKEPGIVDW